MTETIIHIDPEAPLAVLDEHGWTQGDWEDEEGRVCLHGAIRLCQPRPGDAHLIEQVARRQGWGPDWNDAAGRTEGEVRALLARGVDVTDADLRDTFGPRWEAVVEIVRRAATLTADEAVRLQAAWATSGAARAAGDAAWAAARDARDAAWAAARDAAWDAAGDAAWDAAGDAAWAAVTWDLATPDGPYTVAHRDLLIRPWVEVCGLPDTLKEHR